MEYPEFQRKIAQIKEMGYVQSHRKGDTGIGKTLEDLLGITENNIAGPDFAIYELKAGRKESVSMLTLFTKAPLPASAKKKTLGSIWLRPEKGGASLQAIILDWQRS